jgi:hypothetical protein
VLSVPLWVFNQVFGFLKRQYFHYQRAYRGLKRCVFTGNPATLFGFWATDFFWNVFTLPFVLSVVFVIHCIYCNNFSKTLETETYLDSAIYPFVLISDLSHYYLGYGIASDHRTFMEIFDGTPSEVIRGSLDSPWDLLSSK